MLKLALIGSKAVTATICSCGLATNKNKPKPRSRQCLRNKSTKYNYYKYLTNTSFLLWTIRDNSSPFENTPESGRPPRTFTKPKHQPVAMNKYCEVQLQKLVKDAYTQHECPHGEFKKKYDVKYIALTNAIRTAAQEQLSAREFQTWNQPITIQA